MRTEYTLFLRPLIYMGVFNVILYLWEYQNGAFIRFAVIDNARSVIWIKRFNGIGEFEIYIRATDELLNLFTNDDVLITRDNDGGAMITETVKLTTDTENGDYLTISGRSAESIIGRRIIPKQANYSGTTENVIRQMMTDNIINPVDPWRKMDFISLGTARGWTESIDKQVTGKNLLETISDLCVSENYGFELVFSNGTFTFELFKGVDRTFDQTANQYVIFSPTFENLGNTEYSRDTTTYYNSVFVAGQGEGSNRYIVEADNEEKTGLFLREKWIDSRNTSRTTDDGELTVEAYRDLLIQQGKEELEIAKEKTTFGGEILNTNTYIYGVDYNLGDVVQIVNEYGITGTATITEIDEIEDENGYKIYPILSQWTTEGA